MAYVKKYKHDLFISYAHLDNIEVFEQEHGWIEQFYKHLRVLLGQYIGRLDAVDIWWDNKKLDGSILFNQSIADGIKQSAAMITLLSPAYLESAYCRRELDLFYTKAQGERPGLNVGDRSRLLNVLLYNIPYSQWPRELSDATTGFPFYATDDATDKEDKGFPLELEDPHFRKQLHSLRKSIVHLLESIKENTDDAGSDPNPPTDTPPSSPPPDSPFRIYFGDVAESLRILRNRIIKELEKEGYEIIYDVPPPFEGDEHQKAVQDKLERSNLLIHLLDESPGSEMEGETGIWYPQKQVELGLQTDKPQLVWMPVESNIELIKEEQYRFFIHGLENGKRPAKRLEFIRGAKSELTQQITEWADQIRNPPPPAPGKLAVLLDTHYSDQTYAWDVGKRLSENGIQPFINPADDDPRKNADSWEERISQVNKMVFFYGKVKRDWVLERMNAALQLIVTKNYGVEDFFIYMVPPHKEPTDISLKQRLLKVKVVNNSDTPQLDAETLQAFLNSVKTVA